MGWQSDRIRPAPPAWPRHMAGQAYDSNVHAQYVGIAMAANTLYAHPLYVPERRRYTAMGIRVISGASAAVLRIGIYRDRDGNPDSLILDAGVISAAANARFEKAISQVLDPDWYWLASVIDATGPNLNALHNVDASVMLGAETPGDTTPRVGVLTTFTAGPLPALWPYLVKPQLSIRVPRVTLSL